MKKHDQSLEKGDIFKLPVDQAHPTQFAVGLVSVDCKKREMEKAHKEGKLEGLLCEEGHLVPVVIGPGNKLYITDHHHLSSSIWRAEIPAEDKWVYAYVYQDWSKKKSDEFWRDMIESNLAWLYDDKGDGPLNPYMLPSHVDDLLNDPFRTLSRWLRDCGCYSKDVLKERKEKICTKGKFLPEGHAKAFFIEFRWANFLRENVKLELSNPDFSRTCASMPYSSLYLTDEVAALKKALSIVVDLIGCHALKEVNYDKHGCLIK
ncbi:MAG: ParB/Srx family N-terminal domain-containing protein [Magnetococcales bacterium]|nr:ParB/Srx family N-terminal domain-containing protein [Magnetococcales bacterium]